MAASIDASLGKQANHLYTVRESHQIINHRDVPKDATIGSFLRGTDSNKIKAIVTTLYKITPSCGICSPGIKGKNHIIETILQRVPRIREILAKPKEFPRQSAHGVFLDIELGLKYIFTDAGKLPKDYLGDHAESVTFSSPTNLIDSANLATSKMRSNFIKDQVIADEATLQFFGISLTKKIQMYVLNDSNKGVLKQIVTNIPEDKRMMLNASIDDPNNVFCITFSLNTIPEVGIPYGDTIFTFYGKNHKENPVQDYLPQEIANFGNIFAMGNHKKNEALHHIFVHAETPVNIFLKHFLIEIKLLGDANHAIFSNMFIYGESQEPAAGGGGAGGGGAAAGMEETVENQDTDEQSNKRKSIAFGTPDYDVVLRFVLERLNVFYTTGTCITYYQATAYDPINDVKRVVQTNRNTIKIIEQFHRDLVSGDVDIKGFDIIPSRTLTSYRFYIEALLSEYNRITNALNALTTVSADEGFRQRFKENLLKYTLISPVILMPRPGKNWYWKKNTSYYDDLFANKGLANYDAARQKISEILRVETIVDVAGDFPPQAAAAAASSSSSSSSSASALALPPPAAAPPPPPPPAAAAAGSSDSP